MKISNVYVYVSQWLKEMLFSNWKIMKSSKTSLHNFKTYLLVDV